MKIFTLLVTMAFSATVVADMEHKTGMGAPPGKQRLTFSQGCFEDFSSLGCGHPRMDQAFFIACVNDKKDQIGPSCFSFFEKLYGKRK